MTTYPATPLPPMFSNNPASYVGQTSPIDWLDAAADQYEGSSEERVSSPSFTIGEQMDNGKLSARLIIRLINETFLSLPLVNCLGIDTGSRWTTDNLQQHSTDICNVDWQQAKLVQDLAPNKSNKHSELMLSNLLKPGSLVVSTLFNQNNNTVPILEHLNNTIIAAPRYHNSSHPLIDYNLVKLTYLSISSLLSICGILINLFIILIIIFNTKQKRRSILRSNNTGQNNLLLFQLTITGILLTSYVLLDNMDIHGQTSMSTQTSISKFAQSLTQPDSDQNNLLMNRYIQDNPWVEEDPKFCGFTYQLPSLLFTFLPPTPFHWDQTKLCSYNSGGTGCQQIVTNIPKRIRLLNTNVDNDNSRDDLVKEDTSLVITFNQIWDKRKTQASSPSQSWFLEFYEGDLGENSLQLIDITSSIQSVFAAKTKCHLTSLRSDQKRFVRSLNPSSDVSNNQTTFGDRRALSKYLNPSRLKSIASSLCPLLINVIAFIHIWTVAALAYDRYCAIAHPLQYLRSINTSRARTFFFVAWTVALFLNLIAPITINHILLSNQGNSPAIFRNLDQQTQDSGIYNTTQSSVFAQGDGESSQIKECYVSSVLSDNLFENRQQSLLDDRLQLDHLLNHLGKNMDGNLGSITDLALLLMRISSSEIARANQATQNQDKSTIPKFKENFYIAILLIYSLIGFAVVILVPLLIITICNVRIYRIVKVHERRLSINSGSNVANFDGNNQKQHKYDTNSDDRSDGGSITSLLISKFNKLLRATSRRDDQAKGCDESDAAVRCLSSISSKQNCDYHQSHANRKFDLIAKISEADRINSSIIARSRKIVRQSSCQMLTKLANEDRISSLVDIKIDESSIKTTNKPGIEGKKVTNHNATFKNCTSNIQVSKMKRKISDHSNGLERRKLSTVSQFEYCCEHRDSSKADTYSNHDSPLNYNDENTKNDSESIINQLKLAGLSFAGIAIQEPSSFANRTLQKSSSCSLGNLSFDQHYSQYHQNCNSSIMRSSIDTTSTMICPKKSYTSMNTPARHSNDYAVTNKYQTRLTDEVDGANGSTINFHHSHNRLPFTLGTKSAAFNVIIWLILTMLIFTLPNYILVTIDQVRKLNSGINQNDMIGHTERLRPFIDLVLGGLSSDSSKGFSGKVPSFGESMLQVSSIWLSCLCRIMFLSMIPLNGWLYGIRSKSLKASIKVVLKRYISKKQASIEIDQRQRSISSFRSRDSSFINLPQLFNQHRASSENSHRARRCSSLNASRPDMLSHRSSVQLSNNSTYEDFRLKDVANNDHFVTPCCDSKSSTGRGSDNIRFSIGDSYITNDRESDENSTPQASVVSLRQKARNYRCSSLNSSPTLSLASSSKSLMSTSIHSPQSLLEERINQKYMQLKKDSLIHEPKVSQNGLFKANQKISKSHLVDVENVHSQALPEQSEIICHPQIAKVKQRYQLGAELKSSGSNKRRHSANDTRIMSKATTNCLDERHVRKSTSEFKFLITPAEQDHQLDEKTPLRGLDTIVHYKGASQARPTMRNTDLQIQRDFWGDLKRLLLSVSARIFSSNLEDRDVYYDHDSSKQRNCFDPECEQTNCSVDRKKCQMKLARRNSDNQSYKWSRHLSINAWEPNHSRGIKIRNSITMDNIDAVNASNSHHTLYEQTNNSSNILNRSPSYLKPPNFLKLIFDPNNSAPYSGASALSPIKECSSNHSYASSQSSLSNNVPLITAQANRNMSRAD